MKTTINQDGVMNIEPENELEEYALGKWSEENKENPWEKLLIHSKLLRELQENK